MKKFTICVACGTNGDKEDCGTSICVDANPKWIRDSNGCKDDFGTPIGVDANPKPKP